MALQLVDLQGQNFCGGEGISIEHFASLLLFSNYYQILKFNHLVRYTHEISIVPVAFGPSQFLLLS